MGHFTGDLPSQHGHFTGDRQNHRMEHFTGDRPNHSRWHFTGDGQITRSRISWEMAKSQGRAFHGRCQITGPCISREMPNRRSEHFTSRQSLHMFHSGAIFLVAEDGAIHRMDDFFASSDFTGRSADHSMGPFPFFICTFCSQSSLFSFF